MNNPVLISSVKSLMGKWNSKSVHFSIVWCCVLIYLSLLVIISNTMGMAHLKIILKCNLGCVFDIDYIAVSDRK